MKKLLIAIPLFFVLSSATIEQTDLSKAEAMFLYNFSRLIQWPAEYQSGNFVIGILGSGGVYTELANYTASKKVGFQPIEIKKFKSVDQISKCHILFVAFNKSNSIPEVSSRVANFSTLIVSEKSGTIENGAGINFIVSGTRLQFELSTANITKYGLKLSSRLKDMAAKTY